MAEHPFSGGRKAKPTQAHRPVIWEGILGAVYAADPDGEVRYFDHDWAGARAWAQVDGNKDLRIARPRQARPHPVRWYQAHNPGFNQMCLWARR